MTKGTDWTNAVLGALLGAAAVTALPEGGPASLPVVAASAMIGGALLVALARLDKRFARAGDEPRSGGAARARVGPARAFALRLLTTLPGTLVVAALFEALGALDPATMFVLGVSHALLAYMSLEHAELTPPPAWVLRLEDAALRRFGARQIPAPHRSPRLICTVSTIGAKK